MTPETTGSGAEKADAAPGPAAEEATSAAPAEGGEPDLVVVDTSPSDDGDETLSLIAGDVRASATESLADLARAATPPPRPATDLSGGGRTLEELVREALEPHLKIWLDRNLGPMVESIVREEIKKMVRRAEYR